MAITIAMLFSVASRTEAFHKLIGNLNRVFVALNKPAEWVQHQNVDLPLRYLGF